MRQWCSALRMCSRLGTRSQPASSLRSAASYLVLCARLGFRLPGTSTIPERIAADKVPYYKALDAADDAWKRGAVDVADMEGLLANQLAAQLVEIHNQATSG